MTDPNLRIVDEQAILSVLNEATGPVALDSVVEVLTPPPATEDSGEHRIWQSRSVRLWFAVNELMRAGLIYESDREVGCVITDAGRAALATHPSTPNGA